MPNHAAYPGFHCHFCRDEAATIAAVVRSAAAVLADGGYAGEVVLADNGGGRHFQRLTRHLTELRERLPQMKVLVIDSVHRLPQLLPYEFLRWAGFHAGRLSGGRGASTVEWSAKNG